MTEAQTDLCGKCGAEIDPTRRVDFTLRDGTRVCDAEKGMPAALFRAAQFVCRTRVPHPCAAPVDTVDD